MKNTNRDQSNDDIEKKGLGMLIEFYNDLINTPRHIIFWNFIGFIGQAIFIYISVEFWLLAQACLFFILIGYAMDGKDTKFTWQSLSIYIIIFFMILAVFINDSFRIPRKIIRGWFVKFNAWLDNK